MAGYTVHGGAGAATAARYSGHAFGLALGGDFGVPGVLEPDAPPAPEATRAVVLTLVDMRVVDAEWPGETAERTFELPGAAGPVLTIDREPSAGYRVWVDGLGVCVVAPGGDAIACAPPADPLNRWKLLVGQALPIAAALQGLEVLHASAILHRGRAVAFAADSGVGKTTLLRGLIERGLGLLADDVVALEARGELLLAQPGPGVMHVPTADRSRKEHVRVPVASAAPLAGLYFLARAPGAGTVTIEPIDPPEVSLLLGATFVSHVPTAERLTTQLDVCSRIANTVPLFAVRAPLDGAPPALAEAVRRHVEEVVG